MVARPPRSCFHSAEVLPEFVVWLESPAGTWLPLPCSFAGELPAGGLDSLWLQADGCCSKASWASLEVSVTGNSALTRGWQTFARVCGLSRWWTLHFKFDGDATLYARVFGEDGRRAGCYPENDDRGRGSSPSDDEDDSVRVVGGALGSSSFGGSSPGNGSSSGGRD